MAKEIGKLYVSLTIDLSKYTKGLRNASARLGAASKKFMKAGMVMSAAAAPMIIAFTKMTQGAIQYGERTDKMVKSIGMNAEAWTKLAYAAEQEHTNQEVLGKGLMQLTKNMSYAKDGLATYKREFDRMGIKVTDSEGKLRDVTEVLMEMGDYMKDETVKPAQKTAVAMTLLGRAGKEIIPFLKLTREELENLFQEAENLGIVLDNKTAAAFKKVSDGITKAKYAFKGIAITIGKELMPVINRVTATIAVLIERFQKLSSRVKKIITIAAIAVPAILGIGGALTMAAGAAGMALSGILAFTAANPAFVAALGTAAIAAVALAVGIVLIDQALRFLENRQKKREERKIDEQQGERWMDLIETAAGFRHELKELGERTEENAVTFDRLTRTIAGLDEQINNVEKDAKNMKDQLADPQGVFGTFGGIVDDIKGKVQGLAKAIGAPGEAPGAGGGAGGVPSVTSAIRGLKGELRGLGPEVQPAFEEIKVASDDAVANLTTDAEKIQTGFITAFSYMGNLGVKVADQLNSAISSMATGLVDSMFGVAVNWGNIFKGILKSFATMIAQMIIKAMALKAITMMFPGFGGIVGALAGFQHGGFVPGFPGKPQLALVHGGEAIINPKQINELIAGVKEAASGGGHTTIYAMDSESFLEFGRREIPEMLRILRAEGRIDY